MFIKKIAIDLGTANSLVYLSQKGIVLSEPTVVAVSTDDDRVMAVGNEAREMLGKTPENIVATKPLKNGVIADYVITEALLRYFINKAMGTYRFVKPDVMISITADATSVESRAVLEAAYSAGARQAYLMPEPLAAAIGAGLQVGEASGNMIVNIGGGTTEIAIVSLYGMVVHGSVRVAGNTLDDAISTHIRRKYGLIIGDTTAEKVKIELGSALKLSKDKFMEVKGRDAVSGFPKTITVGSNEICDCLSPALAQIALAIKNVLEKTPPELSSDIIDKGIIISGGTALLSNLDKHISEYTGVAVHVADEPLLCVVKGLSRSLDNFDTLNKSMLRR